MKTMKLNKILSLGILILAASLSSFSAWGTKNALAQDNSPNIWRVRTMEADHTEIKEPIGLVFSSRLNAFYALDAKEWKRSSTFTDLIELTLLEDRAGSSRVAAAIQDLINMTYDNKADRLLILQAEANQLLEVPTDANGKLDATTLAHHNISHLGLQDPQGMTVDPVSGDLFVLDAAGTSIVRIAEGLDSGAVSTMDLRSSGIAAPRGIAFDPSTGHLHIVSQSDKKLYELTQTGEVTAVRDLSQFNLKNIQGIVFAPSGDQTDEPEKMNLYLTDTGSSTTTQQSDSTAALTIQSTGQIVEFSLLAPTALPSGTTLLHATLVNLIDTSNAAWNPSAPDPSGVDYWPLTGRLLIVDSEVDEMPNYFVGKNVYQSTTSGTLVSTCSTISFTHEPTGVAINSNNNRIYISDDEANKLHEVSLGPDGTYCTADDGLTTVDVGTMYNIQDAEDVAYGNNTIFIAGGDAAEVYRIPLGANGVLGGGDDGAMTHFDTNGLGFTDLEGIGYNADSDTLFIVSTQGNQNYLGETTISGTLIRAYDLSFMGTSPNIRSDVSYAPSRQNPAIKNIYIASRGVDNNTNPNENDGKVWEINIDRQAPEVISVTRANTNPTNLSSVNFTAIFSENVTGVGVSDFELTVVGVTGASITNVAGSGNTYTVTVNTGSGNGTIRLDVVDNDSIRDGNNNPLGGWGIGNGSFTSGQEYTVSKSPTFTDVPSTYWAWNFIERLYAAGITGGCAVSPPQYCPEAVVNRAQMAVFLLRGRHGSSYTPPAVGGSTGFGDVPPTYWAAAWIKQLAAEGITGGCGSGNYCPESPVTRAQMAVFLLRSKHGASYSPPAVGGSTGFADVPTTYWAAAWIKQLVAEGITAGCGNGNYCPETPVTRAQMAVFLVRTFNLP